MLKDLVPLFLIAFFMLILTGLVKDCWNCEVNGGIYVRGLSGNYCIDPSAVRPPR